MNGCELIRRLKQLPGASEVAAVVVTAYASDDNRERCRRAGCQAVLGKPIEPHTLVSTLERLIAGVA